MVLVSYFVLAILLGGAPVGGKALRTKEAQKNVEAFSMEGVRELSYHSSQLSSSSGSSESWPPSNPPPWGSLCGVQPREQCAVVYAASFFFVVLSLLICGWWLTRRGSCTPHGLFRWRLNSRINRSQGGMDDLGDDSDATDADDASWGLLGHYERGNSERSNHDSSRVEPAMESLSDRSRPGTGTRSDLHSLDWSGAWWWRIAKLTPMGFIYHVTSRVVPSQGSSQADLFAVEGGGGSSGGENETRYPSRINDRQAASGFHVHPLSPFLLTTPSRESLNVVSRSRTICGDDHVEKNTATACPALCVDRSPLIVCTEGEKPTQRSRVALDDLWEVFPHGGLHGVCSNATCRNDDAVPVPGVSRIHFDESGISESDLKAPGLVGLAEHRASTQLASVTWRACDAAVRVSQKNATSKDCVMEENTLTEAYGLRHTLPHVATAIFDSTVAQQNSVPTADDLSDGMPVRAALPSSEARSSNAGSHLSDHEGLRVHSDGRNTPDPPFAATRLPSPVDANTELAYADDILDDGLTSENGGAIAANMDFGSQCSRSYIPEMQPQRQPTAEPAKAHRKRSTRYEEPWQPVPVPAVPSIPCNAGGTACSTAGAAPLTRPNLNSPLRDDFTYGNDAGALHDDLDDLMLDVEADDAAELQSFRDAGRIFSGSTNSSSSASPMMGPQTELVGTPLTMPMWSIDDNVDADPFQGLCLSEETIPVQPPSLPVVVHARTADVFGSLMWNFGGAVTPLAEKSSSRSRSVSRPLRLSVEERTTLLRNKEWLFPLIDGTDEIESVSQIQDARSPLEGDDTEN